MVDRATSTSASSGTTNKPTTDSKRKNYFSPSNGSGNSATFYPSTKLKLLHQRTSLSLAHSDCGWGYCGETALYVIVDPKADLADLLKPGDWNRIRLEARGDTFTVWLNGEQVSSYTNAKYVGPAPIGLQIHAGLPMKVEFRNIRALAL